MRKLLLAVGILLTALTTHSEVAYAGSLNSYENDVIAAAKETYEYDGAKYKVDSSYINSLIDYLSSDGIDLTAEQRDEVKNLAFSNIEQGVEEGYLIPLDGQVGNQDTTSSNSSGTSNTSQNSNIDENEGNTGNNSSGSEINGSVKEDSNSTIQNPSNSNTDNSDSTSKNNSNSAIEDHETASTEDVTPEEMIDQILSGDDNDSTKGDTSIDVEQEAVASNDENIIKNTGFNLENTLIIISGMGLLMLIAVYVTFRQDLFAHKDE